MLAWPSAVAGTPLARAATVLTPPSGAFASSSNLVGQQRLPHVLGIVFPGFHKDPINDKEWGENYTEWWRVNPAPKLFEAQQQPHLPLEDYDLSEERTLAHMASEAHSHGVDSLLFYHYWFPNGTRFLHRPVDMLLGTPSIKTSFALAWADYALTQKAMGFNIPGAAADMSPSGDTFLPNTPKSFEGIRWPLSPLPARFTGAVPHSSHTVRHPFRTDDRAHALWLATVPFADPRYLRVNGKPLFAVFSDQFPTRLEFLSELRAVAKECCGLEGMPSPAHPRRHESLHCRPYSFGWDRSRMPHAQCSSSSLCGVT